VLRQVAAWLVPGSAEIEPLGDPGRAWDLLALARAEQLSGPLLVAVDGGALTLPGEVLEQLVRQHEEAMLWCLHLESRLLEIAGWFEEVGGVQYRVLKGVAAAHLDEPDPSLRYFSDLDLLIASRDLDRAVGVLMAHEATRLEVERRPGFDRRFAKGVPMALPDGAEVDLHRTLVQRAYSFRIPIARLFADGEPFAVGGRSFLALPLAARALNIAYHAAVNGPVPSLRNVRDLVQYLARAELGPETLVPEVDRWRGDAVLARAVRLSLDTLPVSVPAWERWVDDVVIDPAEERLLLRGHRRSDWPVEWSTVRELTWRDRAAFLWAVAVPSASYRAVEGDLVRRRLARLRALAGRR
jgi:hypothetical protein